MLPVKCVPLLGTPPKQLLDISDEYRQLAEAETRRDVAELLTCFANIYENAAPLALLMEDLAETRRRDGEDAAPPAR